VSTLACCRRYVVPALALASGERAAAPLIEDYADEFVTKMMFHYRWAFEDSYSRVAPMLVYWQSPKGPDAGPMAEQFAQRQVGRLGVVGSNMTTGPVIEAAYKRLLPILDALIAKQGYVLGERPSAADFALHGQLSQLAQIDTVSMEIALDTSLRVRAWLDRMEDLSGIDVSVSDWADPSNLAVFGPLLTEIGQTYAPFMRANAEAVMGGNDNFKTTVAGAEWTQSTFPYQAKCVAALRASYDALPPESRATVDAALAGTGCEVLFA
ncbi:MAG: glutathione S-transferase C-terminal domain-containing protein, partial [Pseudomonadota bacterium]